MYPNVSPIWLKPPSDLASRLERCLDSACDQTQKKRRRYVFFRADDVAVPGKNFFRLMELFSKYRVPVCLAVIPARLTPVRWWYLQKPGRKTPDLWCWHQHGWRHINHEPTGKNQEFGTVRSESGIRQDLVRGKQRLQEIMDKAFYPVFTPPWNRCGQTTLQLLEELGYYAASRSQGSRPRSPAGLPDYYVNVDLHTRKEPDPVTCWNNLFKELKTGISSGYCGIMIHHQMMNPAAFEFLEILLKLLSKRKDVQLVTFKDLVETLGPDGIR